MFFAVKLKTSKTKYIIYFYARQFSIFKMSISARISIDSFYNKRKDVYDICGNIINKDKYPFVEVLSRYLIDIVELIDIEIKNSARNSMVNWREKKNPKLLSRLINNDDNVNLINISMNKITGTNYMSIVSEITDALMNDNHRKLEDYCKYLFDMIFKKCIADELFIADYIRFLFGFKGVIARHLNEYINQFVNEIINFLNTNQGVKDYTYFLQLKDVIGFRNVGVMLAHIYKIVETNSTDSNFNVAIETSILVAKLDTQMGIILNNLDWLPANMDDLNSRLYLVIGLMELLMNNIWNSFNEKMQFNFNDILKQTYNCSSIPNKIKFKVLDIQDMIKNMKPVLPHMNSISTITKETSNELNQEQSNSNNSNICVNKLVIKTIIPSTLQQNSNLNSCGNIWETRKQSLISNEHQSQSNENINIDSRQYHNRHRSRNDRNYQDRNKSDKLPSIKPQSSNILKDNKNSINSVDADVDADVDVDLDADLDADADVEKDIKNDDDDDDGFIIVEKKNKNNSKNIYKPKKTPALAIEGGKIYPNTSSTSRTNTSIRRK